MWVYHQSTGELYREGKLVVVGYSGHGEGLNNPALEHARNVGPIPAGMYRIGEAYHHPDLGKVCMNLTPVHHSARGRDAFRVHGDNSKLDKSASNGCIILPKAIRVQISESKDTDLLVVP